MAKYTGTKCIVCEKLFAEGDDIVVCPDCGTPYHRHCWQEKGECINTPLHESGETWSPEYPEENEPQYTQEPLRCIRCGAQNDGGAMFCTECGMPLTTDRNRERPFNDAVGGGKPNENGYFDYTQPRGADADIHNESQGMQFGMFGTPVQQIKLTEESEIDGVRLGDYFDYTGRRSFSMIASFIKFSKTGSKSSMNIVALFFPQYYFFYRKMYKEGLIYMLLWFICSIPTLIIYGQTGLLGMTLFQLPLNVESQGFLTICNIASILSTATGVVAGIFGNYWYYLRARRDILRIRSLENADEKAVRNEIRSAGGTSWARVIVAVTATVTISLALLLGLAMKF